VSRQRSKARGLATQAVYQWQIAGQDVLDIIRQFHTEHTGKKIDFDYFQVLLRGVTSQLGRLDETLTPHLDRSILSVDPVERAILRIACYELMDRPEIPYRVIINEAVEMAKLFGAEQGHKYVNGVLDKTARALRTTETQLQQQQRQ
jgi:N utilization substance protein B